MEKKIITFTADEQSLRKTGGIPNYASNKVSYIEAQFELGENWQGFDAVRAIWYNKAQTISMVLADGKCIVPYEVLANKGQVMVNLVGSISENDVLTDRLTTYPVVALIVDADAKVDGSNTYPITPSQFEQFVEAVKADAESASESAESASASAESASASAESAHDDKIEIEQKIAEVIQQIEDFEQVEVIVNTLPAGSQATSDFTDGVLTLGIPQGAKGDTGNGIQSIAKISTSGLVDTYRITYTDGNSTTFTVTNGEKGDTGNGIASIEKTSTVGLVDTYTITYTDGNTSTFTVTNGEKGDKGEQGEVSRAELDGAVTDLKSASINKMDGIMSDAQTANLIIADAIRYGEYYDASGKIATSASWWRTPLIPATPSTLYSAGSCRTFFYNSSKEFISDNASWSGVTFTTPANTAYIAVCSNVSYTSAYLYLASNTPSSWVKGERLITTSKIKGFADDVKTTGSEYFPMFTHGKNLIDVTGTHMVVVPDYYYAYNTGIKTAVAGMNYVVFPVMSGTNYAVNADNIHVAFFNSSSLSSATYVSGFLSSANNGYTWTVPNGASYMSVSFGNSKKPTLQLEYGTVSTSYEPFDWGMNGNDLLDKSVDFSKLTEAMQTAIGNAITIGATGDYSSILDAMVACGENTTFYVLAGTYDIEAEYTAKYGTNYFTNYNGYAGTGNLFDAGLYLKKGCRLIGLGEVNLVFNYSGSNTKVKNYFAPLNTTSDNVVENINIAVATDSCRYIIHDDFASSKGTNEFRHLVLEGDSHLKTAMGCGMGTANTYIIESCFIDSGNNSDGISIAYHNNVASGAKNKLIIKDCYCNRGIRGGMYGASTEVSKMIVSGCKASSVTNILTDPSNYNNQNIELIQWNNETI